MLRIWVSAGGHTDKRVGVGSSVASLRGAYGSRLIKDGDDLLLVARTPPPRFAIRFVLDTHKHVQFRQRDGHVPTTAAADTQAIFCRDNSAKPVPLHLVGPARPFRERARTGEHWVGKHRPKLTPLDTEDPTRGHGPLVGRRTVS